MIKNHPLLYDMFMFSILMIISVIMSVSLKNEISWDFTNYHYYNAWAFFNNRLNFDIVPASFNTFLNPVLDFPLYFYIQWFNDYPALIWALQGIWGGLMLFSVYKITTLFWNYKKFNVTFLLLILCSVILTGEGVGTQLGSSANEIPVAFFILWGFYILLKMITFPDSQTFKKFFFAGIVMGLGFGLKQTVVTYCLASGLTLILCYKYLNNPVKSIFFFALGGLFGYLIINGYFMYKYWILYENPFFPFLNGIFKSPYFDNFNYRDTRFLPTLENFIIYPFLWHGKAYQICENYYTDIRLTLYYTVFMIFGIFILCFKKQGNKFIQNKSLMTLFVFLSLSFFLWLLLFSYMRYAVVIEVIGAIFTAILIVRFTPNKTFSFILYSTFFTILAGILFIDFHSIYRTTEPINKKIFIEPISLPENTLIKSYGLPTSALIPFLQNKNQNIRALGYMQHHCELLKGSDLSERNQFRKIRDEIEKNHKGPIVFIYTDPIPIKNLTIQEHKKLYFSNGPKKIFCRTWPLVLRALTNDMSESYKCRQIKTNLLKKGMNICVPENLEKVIFKTGEHR